MAALLRPRGPPAQLRSLHAAQTMSGIAQRFASSQPSKGGAPVGGVAGAREMVKNRDYEQYLCGSLMPSAARDSYFVMRAVNLELANVRDLTRNNANASALRFAFWRDTIDAAFKGQDNGQPLCRALGEVAAKHRHTKRWLTRNLDARQADIDNGPPATMEDLDMYCENTQSSLLYLALESVGIREVAADHVASHIGRAVGLATVLRGLPRQIAVQQQYLPTEVMDKVGLSTNALFDARPDQAVPVELTAAVYEVACVAHAHLSHAKELTGYPAAAVPAFISAEVARRYLEQLEKAQFNPFDPSLAVKSPLSLQWALMKHAWRNTF